MAYRNGKRTVYCRKCYQVGHNRRGCPTLTPEQKQILSTGDLARKCSYCRETKHTKRKCPKRANDMATYIKENADYRERVLSMMEHEGLSIGSLVTMGDSGDPTILGVITRIDWNDIQEKRKGDRSIVAMRLGKIEGWQTEMSFRPPRVTNERHWDTWGTYKVLTKRNDIRDHIPDGWLSGVSGADKFF